LIRFRLSLLVHTENLVADPQQSPQPMQRSLSTFVAFIKSPSFVNFAFD